MNLLSKILAKSSRPGFEPRSTIHSYGCFTLSYLDLKLRRKSTTVICISMISKRFMSTLMNLESEEFLGNTERTTILLKIYFMSFWCLKSINVECGFTFLKNRCFSLFCNVFWSTQLYFLKRNWWHYTFTTVFQYFLASASLTSHTFWSAHLVYRNWYRRSFYSIGGQFILLGILIFV